MVGDFARALREERVRKPWVRATLSVMGLLLLATMLILIVSALGADGG
jgi:hypothetical protein